MVSPLSLLISFPEVEHISQSMALGHEQTRNWAFFSHSAFLEPLLYVEKVTLILPLVD